MDGQLVAQEARDVHLDMVCKGVSPDKETLAYVRRKIVAAARVSPTPIRYGNVKITHEPPPSIARCDIVAVTLDVDGQPIRAHAAGHTAREAVDILEERLRHELVDFPHHLAFRRRRRRENSLPGEWRHGSVPTARPDYFPRAPEEREVVRRKTYSLGRSTPEDAAVEMELLDHDFHLFVESGTGSDTVIRRTPDGSYEMSRASGADGKAGVPSEIGVGPPPQAMTLGEAVEHLNATNEPFVFFVDVDTSRGKVLYRRYDGHYGVAMAASEHGVEKGGVDTWSFVRHRARRPGVPWLRHDGPTLRSARVATRRRHSAEFRDIDVETKTVEGQAAHVLPDASKDADLLVVGSRGLGGFRE